MVQKTGIMTKFCESLREHAVKGINFERKILIPLIKESNENAKIATFAKKQFERKYNNYKNY